MICQVVDIIIISQNVAIETKTHVMRRSQSSAKLTVNDGNYEPNIKVTNVAMRDRKK